MERVRERGIEEEEEEMAASLRWLMQLHKDVPKAAKFYSEGLGFTINVCTLRWAELQSGPLKLALLHSPRYSLSLFLFFYSLAHCLPLCSSFLIIILNPKESIRIPNFQLI